MRGNGMKNLNNTEGIDFVITWVDGSDPAWQQEKRKTLEACGLKSAADDRKERYRDWDNLQYWFRGVEQFAPWVRKVHPQTVSRFQKCKCVHGSLW